MRVANGLERSCADVHGGKPTHRFPTTHSTTFRFCTVQFRPLSFRCNCVLWNGQGACENSVCDFMCVLACQRDHIACSSQSSSPLLTTCDVPCFLCVCMSNDVRWLLMAVPRCLQFLFVLWSSVRHRSCKVLWRRRFGHLVLCVRIAREWRACLLDRCVRVDAGGVSKIVLWWCGFALETHCTVPSLWC